MSILDDILETYINKKVNEEIIQFNRMLADVLERRLENIQLGLSQQIDARKLIEDLRYEKR